MGGHNGPRRSRPEAHKIPIHRPVHRGPERRQTRRHRLTCLKVRYRRPLLWRLVQSREGEPCEVSNITSHGVRFYTKTKLRRHVVIEVRFDVPEGVYRLQGDSHLKARVVWQKWSSRHDAYRTGVQFIHVSQATHTDLTRMMQDAALHSSRF